jgi:hypothetical protein
MWHTITIETKGLAFLWGAIAILVLLGTSGMALAAPTDYLNITLNITAEVSIDVDPNTLFIQASVGDTTDPAPSGGVRIWNVGSLDIGTIRANATMAPANPYGTGDPASYNAGDYIQMNASTNSTFRYINSRNWNFTKPAAVTAPAGWVAGDQSGYYIDIRTASDGDVGETYHAFTNATAGSNCSETGSWVRIARDPKTVSQDPDYDFTQANNYTEVGLTYSITGSTPYGIGKIDSSENGELGDYCVLVSQDCATVTLFHWSRDLDFSGSGCDADQLVYSGTLQPGQSTSTYFRAKVPFGVSNGMLGYGIIWFTATAA